MTEYHASNIIDREEPEFFPPHLQFCPLFFGSMTYWGTVIIELRSKLFMLFYIDRTMQILPVESNMTVKILQGFHQIVPAQYIYHIDRYLYEIWWSIKGLVRGSLYELNHLEVKHPLNT